MIRKYDLKWFRLHKFDGAQGIMLSDYFMFRFLRYDPFEKGQHVLFVIYDQNLCPHNQSLITVLSDMLHFSPCPASAKNNNAVL
jgi:hypothetical protein